jgi:hypothetical protein
MTDLLTEKDVEESGHGLMEVQSRYLSERMRKTEKKSQDIRHPGRDSKNALPE